MVILLRLLDNISTDCWTVRLTILQPEVIRFVLKLECHPEAIHYSSHNNTFIGGGLQ